MEGKTSTQRKRFFTLTCQIKIFESECPCPVRQNDDSQFDNFLSPNYSKFAIECDRNSKNSQTVQNLAFFKKKLEFFSKSVKVANLIQN